MKKLIFILALVILAFGVYQIIPDTNIDKTKEMGKSSFEAISEEDSQSDVKSAQFRNADVFHKTSGTVSLIVLENKSFIQFDDFQTTSGPDLYVYLAKDVEAGDFLDLGVLQEISGTQMYELSNPNLIEEYPYVLIWCKEFGVLFGSAEF